MFKQNHRRRLCHIQGFRISGHRNQNVDRTGDFTCSGALVSEHDHAVREKLRLGENISSAAGSGPENAAKPFGAEQGDNLVKRAMLSYGEGELRARGGTQDFVGIGIRRSAVTQTSRSPAARAVRRMVPTFPGSPTRSRSRTNGPETGASGGTVSGRRATTMIPCELTTVLETRSNSCPDRITGSTGDSSGTPTPSRRIRISTRSGRRRRISREERSPSQMQNSLPLRPCREDSERINAS